MCLSAEVEASREFNELVHRPVQERRRFRGPQPLGGPGRPVKMTVSKFTIEISLLGHDIQMTLIKIKDKSVGSCDEAILL